MIRHFWLLISVVLLACAPPDASTEGPVTGRAREAEEPSSFQEPGEAARGPRVVFLGTSLTAGLGLLRTEETYVSRLAEMADSAGFPMQAVNAGVSGDTSAGGLRRVDWILREPLDALVVELGANDGLRGQDPEATAENLTAIFQKVSERYPDARLFVVAMEAPPNLGDRYTTQFREVFPAVAREAGVGLIPFLLEGIAGVPELNQDDGIHPTPEGHRMMAENVWPSLFPALEAWWAEHPDGSGP